MIYDNITRPALFGTRSFDLVDVSGEDDNLLVIRMPDWFNQEVQNHGEDFFVDVTIDKNADDQDEVRASFTLEPIDISDADYSVVNELALVPQIGDIFKSWLIHFVPETHRVNEGVAFTIKPDGDVLSIECVLTRVK